MSGELLHRLSLGITECASAPCLSFGGIMQIIIVGCGQVGRTLAEQLQEEESDITLIDVSANVINSLQDDIDAMGIVGNGASINTLMEAGVNKADILIAVTGSDEMNLLCCLIAQKTGHCQTIARVRNPIYGNEISFIKGQLFNLFRDISCL